MDYLRTPYRLGGNIRFDLNDYLVISDLSGEIADIQLGGSMRWELGELKTRPGSWQSVQQAGEFELNAHEREALWQESFTFSGEPARLALSLENQKLDIHELLSNANGKFILVGRQGRFGSRRLDLWGSDLVTTMLSPSWHREDVTELNCVVARVGIDNGVASSDAMPWSPEPFPLLKSRPRCCRAGGKGTIL